MNRRVGELSWFGWVEEREGSNSRRTDGDGGVSEVIGKVVAEVALVMKE